MKKKGKLFIIVTLFIALCSVFILPYFVPLSEPSFSMSYDIGFNNKVGWFIVFIFASLFIFYGYKMVDLNMTTPILIFQNFKEGLLLLKVVCCTVFFLLIIWFLIGSKTLGIIESQYFIMHIFDLSFGRIPYKDFEFAYGPLLLYIPYWFYHLIPSFSISDGYFLSLILFQSLGLYFLHDILSIFNLNNKHRNRIFILIAITTFPLCLGLNYTLFRFLIPIWSFVLLYKIETKYNVNLLYILSCLFFSILVLNVSPELGIAFNVVLSIYLLVSAYVNKSISYVIVLVLNVMAFTFFIYLFPAYTQSILWFLSGNNNWPFIPSAFLMIFFATVFFLSLFVGFFLKNIKGNLFLLSFELLLYSFIPAALGRCDPGHVFFYGLMIFITLYVHIYVYFKKYLKFYIFCFLTVCLSIFPYEARYFTEPYVNEILKNNDYICDIIVKNIPETAEDYLLRKGINVKEKIEKHKTKEKLSSCFKSINQSITMPLADNEIYLYLNKNKSYKNLYCRNLDIIGSKSAIKRNLNDLKNQDVQYLLLPPEWTKWNLPVDYPIVNILFCTYYSVSHKQNGRLLYDEYIKYINQNYCFVKKIREYDLYKKKYSTD